MGNDTIVRKIAVIFVTDVVGFSELMQKNDWSKAGLNIATSVAICLICTWAGWMLGQSLRKTAS